MSTCPDCKASLLENDSFCRSCGHSLIYLGPLGLDWVWVIYGTALITTFQFVLLAIAGMSFLGEELVFAFATPSDGIWGKVALHSALLAGSGYLVGGIIVGRMSAAHTILEPAVAAGLPAAVLLGYVLVRMGNELSDSGMLWQGVLLAVLVTLSCFLVALFGGFLGERWQDFSHGRKRKAIPGASQTPSSSLAKPPENS